MNQEYILNMIDTVTHPVNMGRIEAVEFLEDLNGEIHLRILKLLREADGVKKNVLRY